MKIMKIGFGIVVALTAMIVLMIACDPNGNGPVADCDTLSVVFPASDTTFHVGDTVNVEWCYPAEWPYDQVKLILWKDGGLNQIRWLVATGGISYPEKTLQWIVQSGDVGTDCLIELSEYDGFDIAYSASFNIEP